MILTILLQVPPETVLPTNLWTVGGLLTVFAGAIAYLFKLYDNSQERRFTESKASFDTQIGQLRKEVEDEKDESKGLRARFDNFNASDHSTMVAALKENNDLLRRVDSKLK